MPEDKWGFKATPDLQTFAIRVAHIADANMRTCAALKGETKTVDAAKKSGKADIVAALKESFAYCDGAVDALTDADATAMINTGRGNRSRLAALYGMISHDQELYGYISVYMRLSGVVPPTSEPR